jgi:hypothetical protein
VHFSIQATSEGADGCDATSGRSGDRRMLFRICINLPDRATTSSVCQASLNPAGSASRLLLTIRFQVAVELPIWATKISRMRRVSGFADVAPGFCIINRAATIAVQPSAPKANEGSPPIRAVTSWMPIFAHAASEPKTKCTNSDPAWVEDLRQLPSPNAQPLRPPEIVARDSPLTKGHNGSRVLMRACARVAFVLMIVSAGFGLAACGAIDDLRDAASRWFDVGSPGRSGSADALPHATPMIPPEKSLKNEASKAPK